MPFGLCNAPATFQRLMDLVLAGIQWSKCLVYLDDIIILGRSFQEHLQHLVLVLQRLREANLHIKPAKCVLWRDEVLYLGHVVSRQGIATDPVKINKVSGWPTPSTIKEVQQFLGLASYYCRFGWNNCRSTILKQYIVQENNIPMQMLCHATIVFKANIQSHSVPLVSLICR